MDSILYENNEFYIEEDMPKIEYFGEAIIDTIHIDSIDDYDLYEVITRPHCSHNHNEWYVAIPQE